MKKFLVTVIKKLEWGSALGVRLTQWTSKALVPTHPKHLVNLGQWFYLSFLNPTDTILDLGCHAGEHSLKAAAKVRRVTGLDINDRLIAMARQQALHLKHDNVIFKIGNLEKKLDFKANQFNKVFLFAVLEHIKNRSQLLKEIRRVLKPGGQLFLSVPNKNTAWKRLQRSVGLTGFADPDHKLEFSRDSIIAFLRKHKFTNISLATTAIDTPVAGLIDLVGGISLSVYKKLLQWKLNQGKKYPAESVGFLIYAQK